jgi:hypothetical protein
MRDHQGAEDGPLVITPARQHATNWCRQKHAELHRR